MTEPQQPTPPAPRDEYVSKYMEGGDALAVSKKRMPAWWFALMALPGGGLLLASLMGVLTGGVPVVGAIASTLLSLMLVTMMALVFSHLRMVVTEHALHVQLGLWGPKIPLDRIQSIRACPYDWKKYGGWGIRYGLDGSFCYSIPGGTGECVEIAWLNEKGKTVRHVVSSDDAADIVATVERARSARGIAATGVRVESSAAAAAEPVELDASSDAAAERRAKR